MYRSYAVSTTSTGGGIQATRLVENQENEPGTDSTGWIAGIPCDGPNADTPDEACNIWRKSYVMPLIVN